MARRGETADPQPWSLKRERKRLKLSLPETARVLGYPLAEVSAWEWGTAEPPAIVLLAIDALRHYEGKYGRIPWNAQGLRAYRIRLGMEQWLFAEEFGVLIDTLIAWERGEGSPPWPTVDLAVQSAQFAGRHAVTVLGEVLLPHGLLRVVPKPDESPA